MVLSAELMEASGFCPSEPSAEEALVLQVTEMASACRQQLHVLTTSLVQTTCHYLLVGRGTSESASSAAPKASSQQPLQRNTSATKSNIQQRTHVPADLQKVKMCRGRLKALTRWPGSHGALVGLQSNITHQGPVLVHRHGAQVLS